MIHRREAEIRAAIAAHPELDDRQIGRLLDIRLWSKVRLVRAAMAAERADAAARTCPTCGYVAKTVGGLAVHDARRHIVRAAPPAPAPPAPAPPPVAILADDVPAATDAPAPRQPVIAPNPVIVCTNCGREGTPAAADPTRCKACGASEEIALVRAYRLAEPWRCDCGRAFARSTRDPERCIKCTGEYDRDLRRQRQGYAWPTAAD